MPTHLGDLLDTARRQRFVGRRRELASFDDAVTGSSPRRVLFVHGQGGIGKTTLLREFRARALAAGRGVVQVDGREIDPSPEGFGTATAAVLGQQDATVGQHSGDHRIARLLDGGVLLVDGYEQLAAIHGWLRREFVPSLSADTVVVMAGRDPPEQPWRTDSGWRHLVAVHHLDHFDPVESAELLAHAGVVPPVRPHLVGLGRGHPLTMALLADLAASGEVPDVLADAPDLISTLLESFIRDAPSEAHLTGLAICAIAWQTTEDLLWQAVGTDAPTVWQWLARRPFITAGPRGLSTHELAREVLAVELERRSPERYHAYRRAVDEHAVAALRAATGLDRHVHAQQLLLLLRNGLFTSAISAMRAHGSAAVVPARPVDHDQVCAIIERFEGPASARLARAWLDEQPDQLSVVRSGDAIAGFAHHLLCPGRGVMETRDPVVRAVLAHVASEGPTRPGERVDILRFAAGAHAHQRDLYAMLAAPVSSIVEWLTRPLAWSFVVVVDTEHWSTFCDFMAFAPLVETDVDGLRHVAYGIDWRRFPLDAWIDLMRDRAHSGETGPPPPDRIRPQPLNRARFAPAVKTALQTLHRPDQLATNPLIGSALAATATGPSSHQLRTTIENAVAHLGNQPRDQHLRAALHRTYLRAAPTQEAAAEVLHLSLSTYRRHLAKATEQLTDLLWRVEIGDVHLPSGPGNH